jgi:hypothetical protein
MDRDEMSNLYREPSIDACYQVSVHLTKRFRRRFKKSANQKQELPVAAMFVNRSGQNEQSLERISIDASNQVSVHLVERFQRRRLKCETLMDDRRRTPSDGKSSHCLWQGELKKNKQIKMFWNGFQQKKYFYQVKTV